MTLSWHFQQVKDMLVYLRSSIDKSISCWKSKMGEFPPTFNDLVDAHNDREDYKSWIKSKLWETKWTSLEETLKYMASQRLSVIKLKANFTQIMEAALPDSPKEELVIDRIHYQTPHLPRDTIAKIHFFHTKEKAVGSD